jgi:hypothetical protein
LEGQDVNENTSAEDIFVKCDKRLRITDVRDKARMKLIQKEKLVSQRLKNFKNNFENAKRL